MFKTNADYRDYIEERALEIASYIIENKVTVRKAATVFGVSKSTIHNDCRVRLREFGHEELADKVAEVLNINKQERHIRGGIATKEMYAKRREHERKYKECRA